MLRLFTTLFTLIFILPGCSVPKRKFVYDDKATSASLEKSGDLAPTQPVTTDYSKPTTFSEYRQWRKTNDRNGQAYAEYKEWEAAYKQWVNDQTKATLP